jgi:ATP phosphoribosyltransferase regulatory subunit
MFGDKKDNKIVKLPYGLRDIFPSESEERNNIKGLISDEFKKWGYGEVKTPVIEYTKNISIGVGKDWKDKLINFFDIDGSLVSLRSDMTIPIARLAGMRIKREQLPVRFCYFADSFRQSEIQKGIRRVYNQAGLEFIGSSNSVMSDTEILIILINILNGVDIQEYRIGLGHVEFIEGLCDWFKYGLKEREYVRKMIFTKNFVELEDFLNKKSKDKTDLFMKLMQPESDIKKISKLVSGLNEPKVIKSLGYLKKIYGNLSELGYQESLITDISIIRDFSYYTGLLFEVYCPGVTSILGSGGRYDRLIKEFGLNVPATGFALDIDLAHKAATKAKKKESFRILLNCASDKKSIELVKMACRLRCSDVIVELCFEKISNLKTFAKEKKIDLVVEVEKDFKKARVTDISRNIETVKKIKDLIKEF